MKFRKWTMFQSKRPHSVLRWCQYPLLVIGIFALGYCAYATLDAKVYQAYETWRFDRAMKEPRPVISIKQLHAAPLRSILTDANTARG